MDKPSGKYSFVLVCLALTLTAFLAFEQVRYNNFINYDDDKYITENPHVQQGLNLKSVKWAFTTDFVANWHPLTWLSHMLDCQLFGVNAGRHHMINLLLHIANTILLFIFLRQATGALWRSAFVAAVFALHPMHVESVAWASERKDVLSTFFGFAAIVFYVKYVKNSEFSSQNSAWEKDKSLEIRRKPSSTGYWLLTTVFYMLSLLSKPMLVTMPFILLLLDYWPLGRIETLRPFRKIVPFIIEKLPFFVLSAGSCIVTFLVQQKCGSVLALPLNMRLANVAVSYVRYIGKLVWPSHLSIFYPLSVKNIPVWPAVIAYLLLLTITAWIIRAQAKHKFLAVGWFWYLGTMVPVIGLVHVGSQAMADRYSYISFVGLFIITAWGVDELFRLREARQASGLRNRRILLGALATTVLLAMIVCTNLQVRYWRDSITVFEHALKVTSNNSLAYNNLAVAHNGLGRYAEAVEEYRQAIRIEPDYAEAHYNLGNTYGSLGRYIEAAGEYKQAIRIRLDFAEAHNNLGNTYSSLGRDMDAIGEYKQAIKIRPDNAEAHYNLGNFYNGLGRYTEAIEEYKQAIRIEPDDAEAYNNLGNTYCSLGRYTEAVEEYRQVIRIKPDNAETYYNLGNSFGSLGRYTEAAEEYKHAIRIKSDFAEAHNNLCAVYSELGRHEEAMEECKRAIRIFPDYADAYNNLGAVYSRLGRYTEAIEECKQAIRIKPDSADSYFNIGLACLNKGDKSAALEAYKTLKQLDAAKAEELYGLIGQDSNR